MPSRSFVLEWIERGLLVVGITLAAWTSVTLIAGYYVKNLPIPSAPSHGARLPGEEPAEDRRPVGTSGTRALAPGAWVARLEAPSVDLSATVLEGSDGATLRRAAGHIEDTALPGLSGHVGIAGHRDTTFRPVRHLKIGERLVLTTAERVFEYRISETKIVKPEDVHVLDPTPRPTLTLVTCYPFTFIGHAPKRFIVQAQLIAAWKR